MSYIKAFTSVDTLGADLKTIGRGFLTTTMLKISLMYVWASVSILF